MKEKKSAKEFTVGHNLWILTDYLLDSLQQTLLKERQRVLGSDNALI